MGTAVAQCLRCCATNRKVTGSIPAGVIGFFIDIKSFRSHCGPGVDSASNRRLTTYHHPVPMSWNLRTLTSWNPLGHSEPVTGLIYLYYYYYYYYYYYHHHHHQYWYCCCWRCGSGDDDDEIAVYPEYFLREQGQVAVLVTCHLLLSNRGVSRKLIHSSVGRVSGAAVSAAGGNPEVSM